MTQADLLNMIAKEAGIDTTYTEGVSKEELIEMVKNNPGRSFFSAEQIKDFFTDKVLDFKETERIFGIPFLRVGDYVKAAMAKQGK